MAAEPDLALVGNGHNALQESKKSAPRSALHRRSGFRWRSILSFVVDEGAVRGASTSRVGSVRTTRESSDYTCAGIPALAALRIIWQIRSISRSRTGSTHHNVGFSALPMGVLLKGSGTCLA